MIMHAYSSAISHSSLKLVNCGHTTYSVMPQQTLSGFCQSTGLLVQAWIDIHNAWHDNVEDVAHDSVILVSLVEDFVILH